jgi:tetratricopeptide (TPR) repeat protein
VNCLIRLNTQSVASWKLLNPAAILALPSPATNLNFIASVADWGARVNRFSTILLCVLSLPAASYAQSPSTPAHSAPARGAPTSRPARKISPDDSKEPFVIESYSTTARFENDGTSEQILAVRARAESDLGAQQLHELVFHYDSGHQQLNVRYVRVRKADGSVLNAAPDAATDAPAVSDSGYAALKEKRVTVPPLAAGDTLEYGIATRLVTPYAPGEFWFAYDFQSKAIVRDEQLEISVPANRVVILKSSPSTPFETVQANARRVYRWKHANLAVAGDDSSTTQPALRKTKPPEVQLTTFADWDSVARWYAKFESAASEPSPEIRTQTDELIQGKSDVPAKAQSLYDFVSTNIHTVDIPLVQAGWQPHSAAEVFINKSGDAGDKNMLLAAMLRAAGIESATALVPFTGVLDRSVPSPAQLDHAIMVVPLAAASLWMDSSTEVAPFRLLASPLRNKAALLVASNGSGKIVDTPADPPFLSSQRVDIDGGVSDLGKLTARAHYTMRGDTELVLRIAFHHTPQSQWNQLAQTILTLDGLRGEVTSVKAGDPIATRDPFELDIDFKQPNFLDWASKRQSGPLPLLAIGLPDPPADSTKPIEIGSPLDVDVKLKLELPRNLTAQLPASSSVSRDYAEFQSSYAFASPVITAERSLHFKMRSLPATRADDYKDFTRAVTADENRALVVINTSSGDPAIPASASADDLVEVGLAELNAGNAASAGPLLARAVELDPNHKQAWTELGLADLRLGKLEEAATAFRRQLEINPADPHANDYLGLALERLNKNEEAAAAFRRQTGIDPLDAAAYAALGNILLAQRDFSHAATELDKATILSPDNAALLISLGRAYLNAGDEPKAIAAFEKAAVLSPTPPVWNDIAFNLADSKSDLDKAQQYAEHAIRETNAKLRSIDPQHVTQTQLQAIASLVASWDTLGWVYAQAGDLEKGLAYLQSAALDSGDGEILDHLGQIYERMGPAQKGRAVASYAAALAAPHSLPETRARLTLLLGGNEQIDELVEHAREGDVHGSLGFRGAVTEDLTADFWVLFAPGASRASPKVEVVQFAGGNESLKPFSEKLRLLPYGPVIPDQAPIQMIRRGTLACRARTGECTFKFIPAAEVRAK